MLVATIPATVSEPLAESLLLAGMAIRPAGDGGWTGVDVLLVEGGDDATTRLGEARRIHEREGVPVVAVLARSDAALVAPFLADFAFEPPDPVELRLRLERLGGDEDTEVLTFKDLVLNTHTYQASLGGRPLDLTYMEYELLRFFVQHPARVWSREQLLNRVWGYDYYGGSRTVDVHVRRLRAKLGEERGRWIATVRSVGYRFG